MTAYGQELKQHLSNAEILGLFEVVQDSIACSDKAEFDVVLNKLTSIIPIDYYACLFCQDCLEGNCCNYNLVTTNYNEEWVRTYLEKNFSGIDPIMAECRGNEGLHYWADVYRRRPPDAGFLSAARDFGLVDGYAAGIQNLSGSRRGLISFSGGGLSKNYRDCLVLEIIVPHLYQAMDRIVYRRKFMEMPAVTLREKEVLKWMTCGKTNWETSVILCVSECTIRFHMNNVMKKLNATSKTHAVAIALAAGLVELD